MRSPFEGATKVALKEIVMDSLKPSKFGYFLAEDDLDRLTDELFDLFQTSRDLKAAGDRLLHSGPTQTGRPNRGSF